MMRKLVLLVVLWCGCGIAPAYSQTKLPPKVDNLVHEWFKRLNALDDWFISMEGKEEPESVVNSFVEMYSADALMILSPSEDQIGSVTLMGPESVRKWANAFARKFVDVNYRINMQTRNEQTIEQIQVLDPPWGGNQASVEFMAAYSLRDSRRRFMAPGAAFLEFDNDGKLRRVRLYISKDEQGEIYP